MNPYLISNTFTTRLNKHLFINRFIYDKERISPLVYLCVSLLYLPDVSRCSRRRRQTGSSGSKRVVAFRSRDKNENGGKQQQRDKMRTKTARGRGFLPGCRHCFKATHTSGWTGTRPRSLGNRLFTSRKRQAASVCCLATSSPRFFAHTQNDTFDCFSGRRRNIMK